MVITVYEVIGTEAAVRHGYRCCCCCRGHRVCVCANSSLQEAGLGGWRKQSRQAVSRRSSEYISTRPCHVVARHFVPFLSSPCLVTNHAALLGQELLACARQGRPAVAGPPRAVIGDKGQQRYRPLRSQFHQRLMTTTLGKSTALQQDRQSYEPLSIATLTIRRI